MCIRDRRRGIDVDAPIDPMKLLNFMISSNGFLNDDMRKMRDGFDIGFPLFDNENSSNNNNDAEFNMSNIPSIDSEVGVNNNILEKYEEFMTSWTRPVNLKYFAARMSQFYYNIGQLISDELMVEYYHKNENFHNILFKYDNKMLKEHVTDSGKYWFGKRDIEPIKPNLKNFKIFCKNCDYSHVCSWRIEGEKKCKELGQDLLNLNETD